jgi:hypothetical protein
MDERRKTTRRAALKSRDGETKENTGTGNPSAPLTSCFLPLMSRVRLAMLLLLLRGEKKEGSGAGGRHASGVSMV